VPTSISEPLTSSASLTEDTPPDDVTTALSCANSKALVVAKVHSPQ